MSRRDTFEVEANRIKRLQRRPTNIELLELYGLYKQATIGDNTTPQPWSIQLDASSKWKAWNAYKGTSKEKAMRRYIEVASFIWALYQ